MAGHGDVKHDYHLVNPSPWPLVGSIGAFTMALGLVTWMKGLVTEEESPLYFIFADGQPWVFAVGALIIAYTMIGWWGDVIKESQQGDHTPVVQIGLRYGMIMFIASEVMFFVAWFWAWFEQWIFSYVRIPDIAFDWTQWPPTGVTLFDPFHLPLLNTLILLTSGTTVTWAHHALQHNKRGEAKLGLLLTVLLGAAFTGVQAYEYAHAEFSFGGNLYGSAFFMATGFHGAHVLIGTIFLFVCLMRLVAGQFTPEKHFGFEAAAWYWHFVDVVWLFLFAFVYVVPYLYSFNP